MTDPTEQRSADDLCARLLVHAKLHDDLAPHSDEQAQWALDLREAARLIREHAAIKGQSNITWPQSKGDPREATWSYGDHKKLTEAHALRMFAHALVERIKELELPVREAMKRAGGDGLDAIAYARMMQRRLEGMRRERDRLQQQLLGGLASAIAHRACTGSEDDPPHGKLHGYCIVCGVPWPCETARYFLRNDPIVEMQKHG